MLLDSLFRDLDFHGTGPRAKRSRDASVRRGRNRARRASAARYQPRLETLEQRLAPSVHLWVAESDGNWSHAVNWRNDDLLNRSPYEDSSAWLKFGDVELVHDTIHDFTGPTTMDEIELYTDTHLPINGYSLSAAPGAGVITLTGEIRSEANGGTNTISLPLNLVAEVRFDVLGSDSLVLSGNGNLRGSGQIYKTGTGTLVMSGDHTSFQGQIEVGAGTLLLGSDNGVGIDETIAVDQAGVLDLNNHDETLNVVLSVGEIRLGRGNLTLDGSSAHNSRHLNGDINGTGGLIVTGNADVHLDGRQNYTGQTRLLSGSLSVDGSSAASPITVSPGAHLYGRGITGPLMVRGSVWPGHGHFGRGVLRSNGDVTFQPGSSFLADIHGLNPGDGGVDGYDQLNVSGRVDLSGSPTLDASVSFNSHPGDSFTILTSTDGITGTFAGLPDGTNFGLGGTPMQIHYTGTSVVLTHLPQFLPPVYYPANAPNSVAVGDFNGDGIPDLAVGNFNNDGVNLLLGNGDGTFRNIAPISLPSGSYPQSVAVGHFHDPNILDLAVTTYDHSVYVALGNGDGTFQTPVPYNVGAIGHPNSLVVGDLNGDGNQDLVLVNPEDRTVRILYGNGDGTFQDAVNVDFTGYFPSALALADLSRDGKLDLVVTIWSAGSGGLVRVLHNDGNDQDGHTVFRHTAADDYRTGGDQINSVALADLGDGHLDLIAGNYFRVDVLTGNGDGTFQRTVKTTAVANSLGESVVVADFDGDGKADVAVIASYGTSHALALLYGQGDGYFQAPAYYDVGGGRATFLAVGDFNGDGHPDLAATIYQGNIGVLINRGDGGPPQTPVTRHRDLSPRLEHSPSDGFLLTIGARAALEPAPSAPETPTSLIASGRTLPVLDVAGMERIFANPTEQDLDSAWLRLHFSMEAWFGADDAWWAGIWQENWPLAESNVFPSARRPR
jgi:autotransporter-associated beta strand protein